MNDKRINGLVMAICDLASTAHMLAHSVDDVIEFIKSETKGEVAQAEIATRVCTGAKVIE